MNTRREEVRVFELGMMVYHDEIYQGKELMKVVGIREHEVELEGDYSGGTHPVKQKDWLPRKGVFRNIKVCEERLKPNGCQLHNLFCSFPDCEPYVQ